MGCLFWAILLDALWVVVNVLIAILWFGVCGFCFCCGFGLAFSLGGLQCCGCLVFIVCFVYVCMFVG